MSSQILFFCIISIQMVKIWPVSIFRIPFNYLHPQSPKMAPNPLFSKIPSWLYFFTKVCVVGTLNLSQEMSDKMQKESGQINCTEPRKCQKCAQNWPFSLFFWHFGCLLWSEWTYCHESFKILSVIFRIKLAENQGWKGFELIFQN